MDPATRCRTLTSDRTSSTSGAELSKLEEPIKKVLEDGAFVRRVKVRIFQAISIAYSV